jgi:hypothetical protein
MIWFLKLLLNFDQVMVLKVISFLDEYKNNKRMTYKITHIRGRGINPVPVLGYWPKSGTGTGVLVIGFSIIGTGSGYLNRVYKIKKNKIKIK